MKRLAEAVMTARCLLESVDINSIKRGISNFEDIQKKYGGSKGPGARDTEPDRNFQEALAKAFLTGKADVPDATAKDWELYKDHPKAAEAAKAMTAAANAVVKDIILLRNVDSVKDALQSYIKKYAWRVSYLFK
jgi:hypothetical protein